MFKLFKFGKLLEEGIGFYKLRQYSKATQRIDEALAIDPQDFTANIWRARTAIVENNIELAKQHITLCNKIKEELEKPLIRPLEILIKNHNEKGCISDRQLEKCDNEVDEKLEFYQHYREFEILDILKLLYYGTILIIVIAFFAYFNKSKSIEILYFIGECSILVSLVAYFLRKSILPLNLWMQCTYILLKCKELIRLKSFIILMVSLFLLIKIIFFAAAYFENYTKQLLPYPWFIIVMVAPIYEEVLFRGVLYNFFKKYNKLLAYIVVSLLFYFIHEDPNTGHFILSILFTWVYDKYKTVVAPIMVHSFYSFILTIYK